MAEQMYTEVGPALAKGARGTYSIMRVKDKALPRDWSVAKDDGYPWTADPLDYVMWDPIDDLIHQPEIGQHATVVAEGYQCDPGYVFVKGTPALSKELAC